MRIELNDLIACDGAGVLQFDRDCKSGAGLHGRCCCFEVVYLESGVAEAVAEGVEWCAGAVPVASVESVGNLREIARVEDGDLSDAAWPAYGELAAGVRVAKEEVRDGVATFGAGIPGVEDGGDVV